MAWAIITIYTSKCAQMDPQQLPKTSKSYSRCKNCDNRKNLRGWSKSLGPNWVKDLPRGTCRAVFELTTLRLKGRLSTQPMRNHVPQITALCTVNERMLTSLTKIS